jgi:hypothetical protein
MVNGTPQFIWRSSWQGDNHFASISLGVGPNDRGIPKTNDICYDVQVLSPHFRGGAEIVQLCTLTGSVVRSGIVGFCDGVSPYVGPVPVYTNRLDMSGHPSSKIELEDSPGVSGYSKFSYGGNFFDAVMFSPTGGSDIYVPLGNLQWNFAFGATYPSLSLNPNILNAPISVNDSSVWPTYAHVYPYPYY